jgi:hypothetical protein
MREIECTLPRPFVTNCDILMRFPYDISCFLTVLTVLEKAFAFNRDLNQWDVAKVTNMYASKSVHILKNDLT